MAILRRFKVWHISTYEDSHAVEAELRAMRLERDELLKDEIAAPLQGRGASEASDAPQSEAALQ